MEELNKNQIVLLVLFVSFVTSIATGIVTVTLMEQSPKGVTQNINQVVERTIERVVPAGVITTKAPEVVPVMVTEEESVIKVINAASPAVVKIFAASSTTEKPKNVGTGFLVGGQTNIVTTGDTLVNRNYLYSAQFSTGQTAQLDLAYGSASSTVIVFSIRSIAEQKNLIPNIFGKDTKTSDKPLASVSLAQNGTSVGQTVIGIADDNAVSVGIVSGFSPDASSSISFIKTNASNNDNVGGPLLNIRGEVVGMNRSQGLAVPTQAIRTAIDSVK